MLECIFHVERSWLAVYETFLARADRVPLLVEVVRRAVPHTYESLLKELVVARDATAGFSLPSQGKRVAEHELSEVLTRVLEVVRPIAELRDDRIFAELMRDFDAWDVRLERALLEYSRALRTHHLFCFGLQPKGYEEFSWFS